jgi:hypothetical protein
MTASPIHSRAVAHGVARLGRMAAAETSAPSAVLDRIERIGMMLVSDHPAILFLPQSDSEA